MEAGKLDRRIRIEQAMETVDPSTGEVSKVWLTVVNRWAKRLDATTHERFITQQPVAEMETGWQLQWSRTIANLLTTDETLRVVDDRTYDVTGFVEIGRRVGFEVYGRARTE